MNLLKETLKVLSDHEKTMDDVLAIGGSEFQITKDDFIRLADHEYDKGYGRQEVARDLVLVGKDFWMERNEYDGSEWWEYKTNLATGNLPFKKISALTTQQVSDFWGWQTLSELNKE